jgi:hypothetical protein
LEPDTDTTAILKLVEKLTPISGQPATATSAYRISTAGTVTRLTEAGSITANGVLVNMTLVFQ